jgi:hypothetical protein
VQSPDREGDRLAKIRLLITSVDKVREIGIDWWEHGPSLSLASMTSPRRADTCGIALR